MMRNFIEPRTRKHVKRYGFLSFVRKHRNQLLDKWLDSLKTTSKKVVHKAAEATGEFIGKKIADKIVKQNPVIDENSRNVEEIILPPEKRGEKLSDLRLVL